MLGGSVVDFVVELHPKSSCCSVVRCDCNHSFLRWMRENVWFDGAQTTYAIWGRRCWYHCRMWEVVLTEGVKRLQSDWWSLKGRRSQWRRKSCLALRVAVVIVMTKSGAAQVCGHRSPRPPEASPSWLIRIAEGGIDGWLRREARKVDMMSSMSDVRGPFQSSHFGSGSWMGDGHPNFGSTRNT